MPVIRDVLEAIHQRRSSANPGSDLFATIDSYQLTGAESAAGVTPVDFSYPPYDVRRYGALGDGSTNDSAAFNLAGTIGIPIFVPNPPVSWLLNSNVTGQFQSFSYPKTTGVGTLAFRDLSLSDADYIQQIVANLTAGTAQTIWCEGDSTMFGSNPGGSGQVALPPPAILQNTVNTWMNNSALTVINNAIGGTSLSDMLAGINGYTAAFATRIATSSAVMVILNQLLNDAYGHTGTTSGPVYRANLITFIRICRQYNKVPVLVTAHPIISVGTFGALAGFAAAPAWTVLTGQFCDIMREVAEQHGVTLIDTNKWWTLTLGTDNQISGSNQNTPLNWFPDGAHGVQATYTQDGQNMVDALLGGQVETFITDMQSIGASRSNVAAKTVALTATSTSRYGAAFADTSTTAQLKILFRVGAPGLDLSLLHPVLNGLSDSIAIQLDGTSVISISQGTSSWAGTAFLQDYETQLVRNVNPGFHMLILTPSDAKTVAFHAIRARRNTRPIVTGAASSVVFTREMIFPSMSLQGASNNEAVVFSDKPPMPIYIEACQMEWTGQMPKSTGVGLGGYYGSNTNAATAQQTITAGLNAAGFLTVTEATASGAYNTTVLDAVDHSGGVHTFAFLISLSTLASSSISCFIDGSAVGGATTLTQAYPGGNPCMWKLTAGVVLAITNWSRIWSN